MSTTERNAIVNPASGLQVYNTTTNCIQIYLPQTGWRDIMCDCSVFPSAQFTFPQSVIENQPVQFTATQSGLNYSWSFQGGSPATATTQNPSVTWAAQGTYPVTLSVTDPQGCPNSFTTTVTVTGCPVPGSQSVTFSFTGSAQPWVVPACVTSINFDVRGGKAGNSHYGGTGGSGGSVTGTLAVTPGQTLYFYVGGAGVNGVSNQPAAGGWNGGGNVPNGGSQVGGGGGGASDIRVGGQALNNRVVVAGGGGGALGANGGPGGGTTGGDGSVVGQGGGGSSGAGKGGTQSTGGAGGIYGCCSCQSGNNGQLGIGADGLLNGVCNSSWTSGAGGGGYYGGGSGTTANSGGGGSNYTGVGVTNVVHQQGGNSGNGSITITY